MPAEEKSNHQSSIFEMGFSCVAQVGLKLLGSNHPPSLASLVYETTNTYHSVRLQLHLFF